MMDLRSIALALGGEVSAGGFWHRDPGIHRKTVR